jgi:hypothetical protein
LAGIAPYLPLLKQRSRVMANVSITPRRSLFDRLEARLAAWTRTLREIRAEAALRRKLEGVDPHLLRDMGIAFEDGRYERVLNDRKNGK